MTTARPLTIEIDCTPRWFAPGPSFDADLAAILQAWREADAALRGFVVDLQAGVTGVRVIVRIPVGMSLEDVERGAAELQASADALDLVSPRRRAVTLARREAREASTARFTTVLRPEECPETRDVRKGAANASNVASGDRDPDADPLSERRGFG